MHIRLYDMAYSHDIALLWRHCFIDNRAVNTYNQLDQKQIRSLI